MIITNFKTVQQASGEKALELARVHAEIASETGADIRLAVQAMDLARVAREVDLPVYAQHVDPVGYGSHTGWITAEAVKAAGATGTLLNHSEHRIPREQIEATVERCKEVGLVVVLCAESPEECADFASIGADMIAYEPPELIGGDISVSTAKPELIEKAVQAVGGTVLVGAGVKNGQDVKIGVELGAKGVLVASGITKVDDPAAALKDLVSGLGA